MPSEVLRTGPARLPAGAAPGRPADGRVARGLRARQSIAEALIDLLQQGVERPTARQLAEHAGVSLRLVFHHFEDMESVLQSAVAIQVERHWEKLEAIAPDGDLGARVTDTVRERSKLYEAIAPVRRAAGLAAGRSSTVASQLEAARRMLRSQLRHTFSRELEAHESNQMAQAAARERELLDAMDVATSFETWDQLRTHTGRSATASRHVVERLLAGALTYDEPVARARRSQALELD